ncbi:large ribosomal subunit protein mL66 [Tribolium castaneum]|uniref:Large ribosomal subunit protein mL66 n=1 Tax=Tribolium castaneum TaxID=7070 RepID=D6WR68_TRICA|nr:PREDICTED: 28S ribosomal protein S18a, mitochondrial [Tribolium castaneum]EFA07649.2 28S ribosomal protein S18a, mitochondrial-like Protein [Tribolium castaneum]|eukprot:XP_008195940.1 PREDICTED: 28S ribosomal protein S18a, mitochondrial [Tribolium castaneum]
MSVLRILNPSETFRTVLRLQNRALSLCPKLQIKQIEEVQTGNNITISAQILPSGREPFLLQNAHSSCCPVCASGLDIKHTDVLILSQFVRSDGCMLPRRVTGLCKKQQKRMSSLVTMAHKAGLMPNLKPSNSRKDPKKRPLWKKFNKYFDESTIKC